MLRDALNAPARTADAIQTLFLGGILTLLALALPVGWLGATVTVPFLVLGFPFVFLPSLLLRGYYVRTMRAGLHGAESAPSFVRWGELVRDGVRSYLVAFAYLLPVGAVWLLVAVVATTVEFGVDGGTTGSVFVTVSTALAALVSALYLPVFAYLVPAALATYAATDRLSAAFSPRTVGRVLVDGEYTTGWLLASGLLLCVVFFGLPLSLFLVGVFVVFYLRTAVYSVYGRAARTALADELDDNERAPTAPVQRRPEVVASVQVGRSVGLTDGHGGGDASPTDGGIRVERGSPEDADDKSGVADGTGPDRAESTNYKETPQRSAGRDQAETGGRNSDDRCGGDEFETSDR